MKKYDLNEGNEALKRVLLMMKYDNKKTLVENTELIFEQTEDEYFGNLAKSFMAHPEQIPNIFDNPTIKPEINANAFFKAISNDRKSIPEIRIVRSESRNSSGSSTPRVRS